MDSFRIAITVTKSALQAGRKYSAFFFHYETENIKLTLGEGRGNGTDTNVIGNSAANVGNRKKLKRILTRFYVK